jgi:class 3 adenylate cyclase
MDRGQVGTVANPWSSTADPWHLGAMDSTYWSAALELNALLDACDDHVREELKSMPEVIDVDDFDPVNDAPPITARKWYRVDDVVTVVADLKGSTRLGLNKYAQSTASIYEAGLRPVVDIFHQFGAGWIPIQGDCVIGLFWADNAVQRAMCAGITAKTFSRKSFMHRLGKKWEDADSGFKVGVATSRLLVKRIGRPASPHQALVWPGKAVNHATKAAQSADAHQLIVTGSMWDAIADNDYITFTCDCARPVPSLWRDHEIEALDHDDVDKTGRCLTSDWCDACGETFCNAILDGEKHRPVCDDYRQELQMSLFKNALANKNAQARARQRSLRKLGVIR